MTRRAIATCALALAASLDWSMAWVAPATGWRGGFLHPAHGRRAGRCTSVMSRLWEGELANDGGERDTRRRFVADVAAKGAAVASALVVVSVPLWPRNVYAAPTTDASPTRDVLEQFGLELSVPGGAAQRQQEQAQRSSKWPRESPSPLPTLKKSAQELTQDPDPPSDLPLEEGEAAGTDMDKALRDASQKKRIDPRTHG